MALSYQDTNDVLEHIAKFDNRKIDEATIVAWHSVFKNVKVVTRDVAIERINARLMKSDNVRIMPCHLMPGPDDWMNGEYVGVYQA